MYLTPPISNINIGYGNRAPWIKSITEIVFNYSFYSLQDLGILKFTIYRAQRI